MLALTSSACAAIAGFPDRTLAVDVADASMPDGAAPSTACAFTEIARVATEQRSLTHVALAGDTVLLSSFQTGISRCVADDSGIASCAAPERVQSGATAAVLVSEGAAYFVEDKDRFYRVALDTFGVTVLAEGTNWTPHGLALAGGRAFWGQQRAGSAPAGILAFRLADGGAPERVFELSAPRVPNPDEPTEERIPTLLADARFVYYAAEGRLVRAPLAGGAAVAVATLPDGTARGMLKDGDDVFVTLERATSDVVVRVRDGEVDTVGTDASGFGRQLVRIGTALLWTSANANGGLYCVDLARPELGVVDVLRGGDFIGVAYDARRLRLLVTTYGAGHLVALRAPL